MIAKRQHYFLKNKFHQTNLMSYDRVTSSIAWGDILDILHLDFSKVFGKVPRNILVDKLIGHGLDDDIDGWICG